MNSNNLLDIQSIQSSNNFDFLKKIAVENNFFKYLNKYAVPSLNLSKIKNFIISCIEERGVKTKLISKPYHIVIDPTNACNLGCPLCPTGLGLSQRTKGLLKFNEFRKIVDEVEDYCIELHLYNWGEPTLNKSLVEMLGYAKSKNIWTRISSNLSLKYKQNYLEELLKSGLNLLHIDIDGIDQDVYSKYRKKGDLNVVIENLKVIKEIKIKNKLNEPIIELAMLAMKQNEHQHEDFYKFAKEFNADEVKIEKIQHNPNMDENWLPTNQELIYKTYESGKASSSSSTDNEIKQCHWPWSGIVVNWDGGANPCCIVDDPKSDFGNVIESSIKKIWNNPQYISSRSEFGDKKQITKKTICNICKNQTHSKRLSRVGKSFAIKL
jgi:MoaA/NifB/PqqE/SkfB family radical SAM enzyme